MNTEEQWVAVLNEVRKTVPAISVINKRDSKFIQFLGKIVFWADFDSFYQGFGRTVYMPDTVDLTKVTKGHVRVLQHEATHVIDSCTFFGLLPWLPWWFNTVLFAVVYLLILPWPGFGRAWAEARAYRRDVELTGLKDWHVEAFRDSTYLFMLPMSKKWLERWLSKPSAYGKRFDAALATSPPAL